MIASHVCGRKLSEAEREVIARDLVRIEANARWDAFFADPRSQARSTADEALAESQGKVSSPGAAERDAR